MFCDFGVTRGVSFGVSQGVSLRVRLARRRGGGGFPLALANTLEVFLGRFRGGEEEATGHLVERGVASVFHPNDSRFPPVDTGHGAHLHARGVRHVDFGADEGVVGTSRPPLPFVGGCLGGGGGLCGRRGGLGAGLSLIGGRGGMAPSDESSDSKCHLEVFSSPVLVTWPWGGDSSFTASSPSYSPPTIAAHVPSSPAQLYSICPDLAHSVARYLRAPTHTSE